MLWPPFHQHTPFWEPIYYPRCLVLVTMAEGWFLVSDSISGPRLLLIGSWYLIPIIGCPSPPLLASLRSGPQPSSDRWTCADASSLVMPCPLPCSMFHTTCSFASLRIFASSPPFRVLYLPCISCTCTSLCGHPLRTCMLSIRYHPPASPPPSPPCHSFFLRSARRGCCLQLKPLASRINRHRQKARLASLRCGRQAERTCLAYGPWSGAASRGECSSRDEQYTC